MNRRNFIQCTGLSLTLNLIDTAILAHPKTANTNFIQLPTEVKALVGTKNILLTGNKNLWSNHQLQVLLKKTEDSMLVEIEAPNILLSAVTLSWKLPFKPNQIILNDQWERGYGDLSWHKSNTTEILPWYFMEYGGETTNGFGVKTGGNTFCSWQINDKTLTLTIDTRSGGGGVALGNRKLRAAEIVTMKGKSNESPFAASRRFAKLMCPIARLPKAPVYGINDWYFSYGKNSEKLILEHTALMAPLTEGLENRPFSVIDAGWFQNPPSMPDDCCWGDNMDTPDEKFGDMGKLAENIRQLGMRPGIWTRPLCGSYKDPKNLSLPMIKGREANKSVLDPTIPENLERVKSYFKLYNQWSYELVKFDFTTYDIFGKWGFDMVKDKALTEENNWKMNDNTKTNAEIVLNLYKTIREAAGETYLLGCNTISHLSAGLFEINRTGDDTSGNEWERTRKMGVNTMAFRGLTHNIFYAADGDCVGLTPKIEWSRNKQWMELLARSGTPLFISAQPEVIRQEQKDFIKKCFEMASKEQPVAQPIDWMSKAIPQKWKMGNEEYNFNWS
jgi:alpha-galactosidase